MTSPGQPPSPGYGMRPTASHGVGTSSLPATILVGAGGPVGAYGMSPRLATPSPVNSGQQPLKRKGLGAAWVGLSVLLVVALTAIGGTVHLLRRGEPVKDEPLSFTEKREEFSEAWFNGNKRVWRLEQSDGTDDAADVTLTS